MTPFETVRQKILTHVKAFHTAHYSTMKIDYPGFYSADPEHDDEFVQVEIEMRPQRMDLSARRAIRVDGAVYVSHFRRKGTGLKSFTTYSDTLFNYLGLKTLDGITYDEVKPYTRPGLPGFDTTLNSVPFRFDYFP